MIASIGSAPGLQTPWARASCAPATALASGADSAFLIALATAGELAALPYLAARSEVLLEAAGFAALSLRRSFMLTCPRRSSFLALAPSATTTITATVIQSARTRRLRLWFAGISLPAGLECFGFLSKNMISYFTPVFELCFNAEQPGQMPRSLE